MIKHTLRAFGALLVVPFALFMTGCKQEPAVVTCNTTIDTASPVLNSGFGFNLFNTRNQASGITAANVDRLALDFTLVEPGIKERRGAPAVTQQAIYFHVPSGVKAVDRVSGCQYWSANVPGRVRSASVTMFEEPTLKKRLVAVGTFSGEVYALDAKTGAVVWKKDLKHFPNHMITGGLQYHNGRLIVPLATSTVILAATMVECCTSHGAVVALNTANGNELWRFNGTENAQAVNLTHRAPNGVSIWSTPVIDTVRNQIIFGTSQNLTQPVTEYADSIVALDFNSGAVKWHYKSVQDDAYNATCDIDIKLVNFCDGPDHDWDVITPVLTRNSSGADVIVGADKSGKIFSLRPTNGDVIWENRVGTGGKLGGVHWGLAVDASKVYVGMADVTAAKASTIDSILQSDLLGLTSIHVPMIQVPNAMPGLYALDKDTGDMVWEYHDTHLHKGQVVDSIYSAALAVTNDVLFAGSLDGVLKAFRTSDGQPVWSYDTAVSVKDKYGRTGNGGTIESVGPVIAGNNVLLGSGYNTFGGTNEFQAGPGNALFVFRLR